MSLQRGLKMRHLHLLAALDEHRHLGRAAAHLHTSQPAVSRALGEIEAAVSQTLFSRTPKGTVPTAAGQALIRHARQALQVLRNAEEEMTVLSDGFAGRLRIGTNYSSAAHLLPNALLMMRQRAPKVQIAVHEGSLDSLLPELLGHRLDVIVARSDHRIAQEGLRFRKLVDEPMCLVAGPAHPLAKRRKLRWNDLQKFLWILPLPNNPVRDALDAIFLRHGLRNFQAPIECGSILVNSALLSRTDAIAVLPRSVAQRYQEVALLKVLPLSLPEVFSPIGVITPEGETADAVLTLFEQCLKQASGEAANKAERTRF